MSVVYVRNNQGEFESVGSGGATTDITLSQVGKPADAGAVGDAIAELSKRNTLNYDESIIDLSIDGQVITYVKGDGSQHEIITQDTDTIYSAAGSDLGLVQSGGDVTISDGVITVNDYSHNHAIVDVDDLDTELASKVPITRTINNQALSDDITLTASDVGADVSGAAASALTEAKSYADIKVADLVNSAPETLDTLGELATALQENASVVDTLNAAIGNKANASDLTAHIGDTANPHGVTAEQVRAVSYNVQALTDEQRAQALENLGAAATSHTQSASTITDGIFAGEVSANSSAQTPGASLIRNSRLVTEDTDPTVNGEICWMHE